MLSAWLITLTLTVTTAPLGEAQLYLNRGQMGATRALLEEIVAQDPRDIEALLVLALLELEEERDGHAIALLKKLLLLDPFDDDSRLELAQALWRVKNADAAHAQVDILLTRHPEWPAAKALKTTMEEGRTLPALPSPWRFVGHGDLAVGYDSNFAFDRPVVTDTLSRGTLVGSAQVSAGLQHMGRIQPYRLTAHLRTQQSIGQFDELKAFMPNTVGLSAMARTYLGPIRSQLNLQYEELFTNHFTTHYHRALRSTVSGAYDITKNNTLQLLSSVDWRQITGGEQDTTARVSLRDRLTIGRFSLAVNTGLRLNVGEAPMPLDPRTLEVGFFEVSSAIFGEYQFLAPVRFFLLADFAMREFNEHADDLGVGLDESTLFMQLGVVWSLVRFDVHSEYAYTRNRSNNEARDFNRHQLTLGVRYWYD